MRSADRPFLSRRPSVLCLALAGIAGIILLQFSVALAAPQQTGLDMAGKRVDPLRAAAGKVAVLVFVRTDCPISNRYAPLLERLSNTYAGKAKFWLVYPDKKTGAEQIARHREEFHYSVSALRDPQHALVRLAKAAITPEAAVFDANGNLIYHGRIDNWYEDASRARPAATTHELEDAVEAAIAGKPAPIPTANAVGCYISDLE